MVNAFAAASGQAPVFGQTTTAGLGFVAAGLNLYDALKHDNALGAAVAASHLAAQVGTA